MSDIEKGNPAANGGYMETYSGFRIEYYNPDPKNILITDIAASLAKQTRYTGHTSRFYSVAEHCVLASMYAETVMGQSPETCLAVLMHDAAEAYIGDLASPIKHLMPEFKHIEDIIMDAIHARFGIMVTPDMDKIIHELDVAMLVTERNQLLPNTGNHDWNLPKTALPLKGVICAGASPADAEKQFLMFFEHYKRDIDMETASC